MIVIILHFYGTYILRKLSSEVQQNIFKLNPEQGCTKVVIGTRDHRQFIVEMYSVFCAL